MATPEMNSAGYQSYAKNKELHYSEARSTVRGSFMKSTSSSNFGTKIKTQEDPNDEISAIDQFNNMIKETMLHNLSVPRDEKNLEAISESNSQTQ